MLHLKLPSKEQAPPYRMWIGGCWGTPIPSHCSLGKAPSWQAHTITSENFRAAVCRQGQGLYGGTGGALRVGWKKQSSFWVKSEQRRLWHSYSSQQYFKIMVNQNISEFQHECYHKVQALIHRLENEQLFLSFSAKRQKSWEKQNLAFTSAQAKTITNSKSGDQNMGLCSLTGFFFGTAAKQTVKMFWMFSSNALDVKHWSPTQ